MNVVLEPCKEHAGAVSDVFVCGLYTHNSSERMLCKRLPFRSVSCIMSMLMSHFTQHIKPVNLSGAGFCCLRKEKTRQPQMLGKMFTISNLCLWLLNRFQTPYRRSQSLLCTPESLWHRFPSAANPPGDITTYKPLYSPGKNLGYTVP